MLQETAIDEDGEGDPDATFENVKPMVNGVEPLTVLDGVTPPRACEKNIDHFGQNRSLLARPTGSVAVAAPNEASNADQSVTVIARPRHE